MKREYKELLDRMRYFFENYKDIPDENLHEECMKNFVDLTPLLSASKDDDVLVEILTFFEEEFDYEFEGVCEDLKSQIGINFTLDQLLQALYKKFDYLATHNVSRLVQFSFWFFANDMFAEFREMFNIIKSNQAKKYLDELDDWSEDDFEDERALLREDMKKW